MSVDLDHAQRLHRESLVFDSLGAGGPCTYPPATLAHIDELMQHGHLPGHEILTRYSFGNAFFDPDALVRGELPEYWEGWESAGVDVSHVTIGQFGARPMSFENALRDLSKWTMLFDRFDRFLKVTAAADAEQAHRDGRHGLVLGFQDTSMFEGELEKATLFHRLGVRVVQLTVNARNLVGDGCAERDPAGLSNFGHKMVAHLNELGVLIDVSHCSDRTAIEAAAASSAPVVMTHTAARAVYDHHRWKTDEALRAVGERGYIGVPILGGLRITAAPVPTLEHFFEQLDYIVSLVGPEHVGIGTNGDNWPPQILDLLNEGMTAHYQERLEVSWKVEGYAGFRDWPALTAGLLERGYSDDEVRGLIGGNFLRVFREAVG